MTDLKLRAYQLSCGHWIVPTQAAVSKRQDGWYAALRCHHCGRKRSVICASFGRLGFTSVEEIARAS